MANQAIRLLAITTDARFIHKPFLMVSALDYLYDYVWEYSVVDPLYILGFSSVYGCIDFSYSERLSAHNVVKRSDSVKAVTLFIGKYALFVYNYTGKVTLPKYVRSVLYVNNYHERGLHLLYVVAKLQPTQHFELARSSKNADVELNPGPVILSNSDIVSATLVITVVPLLGFVLSWEIFLLWALFVLLMVVYYPAPGTERPFYRKYRAFVVPLFMSFALVGNNYIAQFRLARDSTMHDIEMNPGPVSWADDPERYTLLAGLGTLLHQYDVRSFLIASGVNSSSLDSKYQQCVSAEACANYYRSLDPRSNDLLIPAGVSVHAVAKAFRAMYPSLRDDYVQFLRREHLSRICLLSKLGDFPVCSLLQHMIESRKTATSSEGINQDNVARILELDRQVEWLSHAEKRISMPSDSFESRSVARGVFCERCQCHVNPNNHEERCAVVKSPISGDTRVAAWIGDAIHTLDVRLALVQARLPEKKLSVLGDTFKSAAAQAKYLRTRGALLGLTVDINESDRRLSTQFEAMYGNFRSYYITELINDVKSVAVGDDLATYEVSAMFTSFELSGFTFHDLL